MNPFKKIFLLFTFLFLYLLVNISTGDEQGQHAMHGDTTSVATSKTGEGPVINEYVIPTPYSHPFGIVVDSKDKIWFTAQGTNKIVKFDPVNQTFKEYQIPSTAALPKSDWKYSPAEKTPPKEVYDVSLGSPGAIIIDKNDKLWFVEQIGNKIGSFEPSTEKFVEYDIPTPQSSPNDLALDSEGNVWFIEWNSGKIGKLDFKIKKVGYWTWIVRCRESKHVIAWHISQTRLLKDARAVLRRAMGQSKGVRPEKIITDGLWQYPATIKKEVGWNWREQKIKHVISSGIGKNAFIERLNREIKRRLKWFSFFQALEGANAFFGLFFYHFNQNYPNTG